MTRQAIAAAIRPASAASHQCAVGHSSHTDFTARCISCFARRRAPIAGSSTSPSTLHVSSRVILGLLVCASPALWATDDIPLEEIKILRREIEALDRGGLALRDGEGRPIPPREEACEFPFRGIDATSWYLPRWFTGCVGRANILLGHR